MLVKRPGSREKRSSSCIAFFYLLPSPRDDISVLKLVPLRNPRCLHLVTTWRNTITNTPTHGTKCFTPSEFRQLSRGSHFFTSLGGALASRCLSAAGFCFLSAIASKATSPLSSKVLSIFSSGQSGSRRN